MASQNSSSSTADADAEDINDFLQRIKELGQRRDQEDEERNRKLEEEILQGRKERQARREERRRSISPTKSSPASTPPHNPYRRSIVASDSARYQARDENFMTTPTRKTTIDDAAAGSSAGSPSIKENAPTLSRSTKPGDTFETVTMQNRDSNPTSPVRELSWQRRPKSQASDRPRSRPLSQVARENASAVRSPVASSKSTSADDTTISRDQITHALASKDPSFFRQTADRGASSAAYRKNQVEDVEVADDSAGGQLLGMSRPNANRDMSADSREVSPTRGSPVRGSRSRTMPSSMMNSDAMTGTRSPMPTSPAQRFDPPGSDTTTSSERNEYGSMRERTLAMSPAQGRISPERAERPQSPTKGMGGFVQSAMMKRSDSVNKRWSVQSPTGLTRTNSVTSNRSSHHPSTSSANFGELLKSPPIREPTPLSREHTPRPSSRPTSSYGGSNATVIQNDIERVGTPSSTKNSMTTSTATNDGFLKPSLPASYLIAKSASSSKDDLSLKDDETKPKEPEVPTSPSRTMDTKRWSPTKSSWLESALNKPDSSPKPKAAAPPPQPSWMTEIVNAKARQKSIDLTAPKNQAPKHEVKVGGLMRSPAMGVTTKPLSLAGLPHGFNTTSLRSPDNISRGGISPNKTDLGPADPVDGRVPPRLSSSSLKPEKPGSSFSNISTPEAAPKSLALRSLELGKSPDSLANKPEIPPKKDFRSNLKPRQPPPMNADKNEAEFKSVFGQLKRTKTQKYVAPDELKDNILRGKSALNFTGGPKKTERTDEFKDAILKKKKDFEKAQVEGKGVVRTASSSSQGNVVPEAIAKRKALASEKDKSGPPATPPKPLQIGSPKQTTPKIVTKSKAADEDELKPKALVPHKEANAPGGLQASGKLADRFNPALANLLARGPPSAASETSRVSSLSTHRSTSMGTSADVDVTKPGPKLEHVTKSRARGPRRKAPSSMKKSDEGVEEEVEKTEADASAEVEAVVQNPTISNPSTRSDKEAITTMPTKIDEKTEEAASSTSQPTSPRKRTMTINRRSRFLEELANKNEKVQEPTTPKSPIKKLNLENIFQAPTSPTKEPLKSPVGKLNHEFIPKSPSKALDFDKKADVAAEVKNNSVSTTNNSTTVIRERPVAPPKSPVLTRVGLGVAAKINDKTEPVVSKPEITSKPAGFELKSVSPPIERKKPEFIQKPTSTRLLPKTLAPVEVKEATIPHTPLSSASPSKKGFSLPNQTTEASKLLREFFGEPTSAPPDYEIDTAAMLMNKPSSEPSKVDTISYQLYQLSAGGKKTPVPQSQTTTLFEGNLYLCIHNFKTISNVKATEVYLWIGDDLSYSDVQDAEIYASREAKAVGGKLIYLYQGRESSAFFQTLGGIVITRRGTSNKYDSLAPYILCGRQYLDSIAFDEVDFLPTSLCSGFPYLINSQSANMWLWKGKGSSASELSNAKDLALELAIMGAVNEVEEGSEPDEFLQVFGGGRIRIRGGAGHWKLKTNYPGYRGRLFKIEATKATEISPFTQTSISPHNIYILDAFFEIYIIAGAYSGAIYPGASATAYGGGAASPSSSNNGDYRGNQFFAFHTALHFAQEYGILAAGMEDRPFVPVSTVVLEGMPKDARVVVRKWKEGVVTTKTPDTAPVSVPTTPTIAVGNGHLGGPVGGAGGGGLRRGRSLRVVPLMAALEATRH